MPDRHQVHILAAALDYTARGWSVIPLRPRDKRPLIPWTPYQQLRADETEIRGWLGRWHHANLGIVTGVLSGLVVLDVDPQHGGEDSLASLEQRHGALPETVTATTGGGGRHLYLAHPGGVIHNRVGVAPGIDLRGDGGYIVAPPSVHPSGRHYAWVVSHAPADMALAAMPAWLVDLVRGEEAPHGHPMAHWRRLVRGGVAEGERNNTIASLAGHLLWHGVDPQVVLDLLLAWNARACRPPLDDDEVARTVESILRLHRQETGRDPA